MPTATPTLTSNNGDDHHGVSNLPLSRIDRRSCVYRGSSLGNQHRCSSSRCSKMTSSWHPGMDPSWDKHRSVEYTHWSNRMLSYSNSTEARQSRDWAYM